MNGIFNGRDSLVDVVIGTGLQTRRKSVVFIPGDILTRLVHEINRLMKPAIMVVAFVYRGMVFEILPVVNGSLLDLVDGGIDLPDGIHLIYRLLPVTGTMLDHPTGGTEIRQRMKISRMKPLLGVTNKGDSPVDMIVGAGLQTLGKLIVFVMAYVLPGFIQIIESLFQPTTMITAFIDGRMILEILAIIDGRLLDLADRGIDLSDGIHLVNGLLPVAGTMLEHPVGSPQIGKRMKIIRMLLGPNGSYCSR